MVEASNSIIWEDEAGGSWFQGHPGLPDKFHQSSLNSKTICECMYVCMCVYTYVCMYISMLTESILESFT